MTNSVECLFNCLFAAHISSLVKHLFKSSAHFALATVAQVVGVKSRNWKVAGLTPSQGTYLGCSLFQSHTGGSQSMLLSRTDVSYSPFLCLSKRAMKNSSGEE